MGRKKPDDPPGTPGGRRRHTAMIRVESDAADKARAAATLLGMSVADYVTGLINKHAPGDIARGARRFAGGGEGSR